MRIGVVWVHSTHARDTRQVANNFPASNFSTSTRMTIDIIFYDYLHSTLIPNLSIYTSGEVTRCHTLRCLYQFRNI